MLLDFFQRNFITFFLSIGFSMKLAMSRQSHDAKMSYMWLTVICVILLTFADFFEGVCAEDESLRFMRILLSVIGYVLRPVAGLSLVMVVAPTEKSAILLWIPALINALIVSTAFFSPIAFSFDENYEFSRGPLGAAPFVASFFYIVAVLWFTRKKFRKGRVWEVRVLYMCAIGCAIAAVLDAILGGFHVNQAIIASCIFFYIFIRSQDNNRDGLTRLRNRKAFYEDVDYYKSGITAAASVDMNGLKRINDYMGHDAGDQALQTIGESMLAVSGDFAICYRMGGDEFMILFLGSGEETVAATLEKIRLDLKDKNISVSMGYAMREASETVDELCKLSDQRMYENKAVYYNRPDHNRRRRAGDR